MAIRIPRGYDVNTDPYREVCEGNRPTVQAVALRPWSGLPDIRFDKHNNDPIVLDAGTLVGCVTYTGDATKVGTLFPACLPSSTGVAESANLIKGYGSSSAYEEHAGIGWPAAASGNITNVGFIKPLGVCYQPVYSDLLRTGYTNYKRTDSVGFLAGPYVVEVPCISAEEIAINQGDVVVLGSGNHWGSGWNPYTFPLAGRYAKYDSSWAFAQERIVGRCLKRIKIATTDAAAGVRLRDDLTNQNLELTAEALADFGDLNKIQTVPGHTLTGSGTKGIPQHLLDARSNGSAYYCFRFLVRV